MLLTENRKTSQFHKHPIKCGNAPSISGVGSIVRKRNRIIDTYSPI